MTDTGPNYPAIIRRSADDVAEALTAAEQRGVAIVDSLPVEQRAQLLGWLRVNQTG